MKILAIAVKGHEWMYKYTTAHKVSQRSGDKICKALNEVRWQLEDGEVWHAYEVEEYEQAYIWAEGQEFHLYKGRLREVKGGF